MQGFFEFIRKQGVIGLAIGFILGGAVSKVVSSFVEDVINPLIAPVLGTAEGLNQLTWQIGPSTLNVGSFLAVIIDFVVIAAVVYFIFKGLKLDKLDTKE